jgi:hypothetical protein
MKGKKDCAEPRSTIPKMKEEKGMMHARIYPGQATSVNNGSPYENRKAPSFPDMTKGLPRLLASSNPLAIRTTGFE